MGEYDAYASGPVYEAAVDAWGRHWDDPDNGLDTMAAGQAKAEAALIQNGYSPYGAELVVTVAQEAGDSYEARLEPLARALMQATVRMRPPRNGTLSRN